jgi:TorA maturation chaperone TorD
MARQSLYRFAALALVDPRTGTWADLDALDRDGLLSEAASLIRRLPEARASDLGPGEWPLERLDPAVVLELRPRSARDHNAAYERTFGLLVSGDCPPYETEYIGGKFTFQRSNALADINGFYTAFGLAVSSRAPERPDHIVLELEFMASLIGLSRHALTTDVTHRRRRKDVCRAAQRRFLREHLAWWTPAFARLLSREHPNGFYAAVASFLAALIPAERALLNLPACSHELIPSPLETPEECAGCQLSA